MSTAPVGEAIVVDRRARRRQPRLGYDLRNEEASISVDKSRPCILGACIETFLNTIALDDKVSNYSNELELSLCAGGNGCSTRDSETSTGSHLALPPNSS
jgi:hypothetical protein